MAAIIAVVGGDQRAGAFVEAVATQLGESAPVVIAAGVSTLVRLTQAGRSVQVTARHHFEVELDLSLPGFASDTLVSFAPEGLYERAKLLEVGGEAARALAAVPCFDRLFVVQGGHAATVVTALGRGGWDALVDAQAQRPDLLPVKFSFGEAPRPCLHVRARPALEPDARIDRGTLAPSRAVAAVQAVLRLARSLEQHWTPPR